MSYILFFDPELWEVMYPGLTLDEAWKRIKPKGVPHLGIQSTSREEVMKFDDLSDRYKDAVRQHIEDHLGHSPKCIDIDIAIVMGLIANGKLVFVGGPGSPALDKPDAI